MKNKIVEGKTYSCETWEWNRESRKLEHTGWSDRTVIRVDGAMVDFYYFDIEEGNAQLGRMDIVRFIELIDELEK